MAGLRGRARGSPTKEGKSASAEGFHQYWVAHLPVDQAGRNLTDGNQSLGSSPRFFVLTGSRSGCDRSRTAEIAPRRRFCFLIDHVCSGDVLPLELCPNESNPVLRSCCKIQMYQLHWIESCLEGADAEEGYWSRLLINSCAIRVRSATSPHAISKNHA